MPNLIEQLGSELTDKPLDELQKLISSLYMADETQVLQQLLPLATPSQAEKAETEQQANELVRLIRADKKSVQMIDALLLEYSLDTQEGILLMCLAEALMRIPDAATADGLIRDKLAVADWKAHLSDHNSVFVNASTWGLMLTGKVCRFDDTQSNSPVKALFRLVNKLSEPVIRRAMNQAMAILGRQFVLGRNIEEAQKNSRPLQKMGFDFSFDMLGESALTAADADTYFNDYLCAIEAIGEQSQFNEHANPSVSIKLSALHPRYEVAHETRVMQELFETVLTLAERARELNVPITIDAEEIDRLELSLKLFEKLYRHSVIRGWGQFGLVVQSYSRAALAVFAWLNKLAEEQGDRIPVRLVKGAYWDTEIKLAQQHGYKNYAVFTRKEGTDVCYLACARYVLGEQVNRNLYPQFASHNAQTVTAIVVMGKHRQYELQRLHGMGDALYHQVKKRYDVNVRIYAPVGSHKDLLPYLVRRLLENGANSSFVHRLVDASCPPEQLTKHPVEQLLALPGLDNQAISLPPAIYPDRKNSLGINMDIDSQRIPFNAQVNAFLDYRWTAGPVIGGKALYEPLRDSGEALMPVTAPYDRSITVGQVIFARSEHIDQAFASATEACDAWRDLPVTARALCLNRLADLLEENRAELVALCHMEAGKTIHDAIDEIREAVDFCRYYATQSQVFQVQQATGFDGKPLAISRQGRGVFVCISPWNFPLAIFLGQITAALMAGNAVIAKPAEQTSLIAARAARLIQQAGFPDGVFHLLLGNGTELGSALIAHPKVAGVAFTGSTQTAMRINQSLAGRAGEPIPMIAETGGQNAMIVDSTALPQQVVRDVLRPAFGSAGQRCSALRVLCIQEDVAEHIIKLISGAMDELSVGIPYLYQTDVGPVIDSAAKEKLNAHIEQMKQTQQLVKQLELVSDCDKGDFVAPAAFEISDLSVLTEEKFGPILHIVRFKASELPQLIEKINATGYGLTLGIHSRNATTYQWIEKHAKVGNSYVNRDQIGAVVGVQPFGGQGLSGTGPKAGGPHYLYRFTETKFDQPVNAAQA